MDYARIESLRFRTECADLENRVGAQLSPSDYVKLWLACDRVDHPYKGRNLDLIGKPVVNGNLTLYKLTVGASVWLDECAEKWWGNDTGEYFWALVYALSHGRIKGAFDELLQKDKAEGIIRRWSKSINITREEVDEAVSEVLEIGRDLQSTKDKQKAQIQQPQDIDWASLIQELEIATGVPAHEWLYGKSAEYTLRAYAKHREILILTAGGSSGATDELDASITQLALTKKQILTERTNG
jgi:hypothetical protein